MDVQEIRAALESFAIGDLPCRPDSAIEAAFIRVGLRACDEWDKYSYADDALTDRIRRRLTVITDILREAGWR